MPRVAPVHYDVALPTHGRNEINMGKLLTCVVAIATLLAGCGGVSLKPHRIDVQQGNAVEAAQADRVREGMTRRQVRFLLGTPLIADTFRDDRWEYVYFFKPGRGTEERRRLSVFFADDVVIRVLREGLPEPVAPEPMAEKPALETPAAVPVPATETPAAAAPAVETPAVTEPAAETTMVTPGTTADGASGESAARPTPVVTPEDAPASDCILPAFVEPKTESDAAQDTKAEEDASGDCVLRAFQPQAAPETPETGYILRAIPGPQ